MADVFTDALPAMQDDSAPDVHDGTPLSAEELDTNRFQVLLENDRYLKETLHYEAVDPATAPAHVTLVWVPAANRVPGGNLGWVRVGFDWYPFGVINLTAI